MKIVAAWLVALSFAVVIASSCSINHKSDDYACQQQSDCDAGRECISGFCVVTGTTPNDARIDAPGDRPKDAPAPDSQNCPAQCTSCNTNENTCIIDCAQTDCGNDPIVCPPGYRCDIRCSTSGACDEGIDCSDAESCNITCSGPGSCQGVNCAGAADCTATCSGQNSCRGMLCIGGDCDFTCNGSGSCRQLDCDGACACDVRCGPGSDCSLISCPDNENTFLMCRGPQGRGCNSMPAGCNTCQ